MIFQTSMIMVHVNLPGDIQVGRGTSDRWWRAPARHCCASARPLLRAVAQQNWSQHAIRQRHVERPRDRSNLFTVHLLIRDGGMVTRIWYNICNNVLNIYWKAILIGIYPIQVKFPEISIDPRFLTWIWSRLVHKPVGGEYKWDNWTLFLGSTSHVEIPIEDL